MVVVDDVVASLLDFVRLVSVVVVVPVVVVVVELVVVVDVALVVFVVELVVVVDVELLVVVEVELVVVVVVSVVVPTLVSLPGETSGPEKASISLNRSSCLAIKSLKTEGRASTLGTQTLAGFGAPISWTITTMKIDFSAVKWKSSVSPLSTIFS